MRIAITGSRGFLGGSFGRYAAAKGHEVLGISRSSQPDPDWPGLHVHADCLHADLSAAFRTWRPEAVLHAAGSASVGESLSDPLQDLRALAMTLGNTLDGIRRAGIAPVLLLPSSAAVYGNPATLPVAENGAVAPISPYGFHKVACEILGREAADMMGLRVVICRFFSVYGSRQRRLLIWEVYQQLTTDTPVVELQGTGSETRDFLHVEDVCGALEALALHAQRGATIVNVASGTEVSVSQVAEEMKRLVDKDKMLMCHGSPRQGDPRHWGADISRLRSLVPGWKPKSLQEGLTETIAQWAGT